MDEIELYKKKVEFYREQTDKVRKFVFSRNDIGEPCQPIFDAIHDKLTEQEQEISRLQELLKWVFNYYKKEDEDWEKFAKENNIELTPCDQCQNKEQEIVRLKDELNKYKKLVIKTSGIFEEGQEDLDYLNPNP